MLIVAVVTNAIRRRRAKKLDREIAEGRNTTGGETQLSLLSA